MTRYAEVRHDEWIAADLGTVRSQFADLEHHIEANVHPKLGLRVLQQTARRARYIQEVTLLGIRQRDVFEREFGADGSMTDTSVEGFNKGGSLHFEFGPETRGDRAGTVVSVTIRLPLPPVVGALIRPLLEGQIRRELLAAVAEDKHDLEVRGYVQRSTARPTLAEAA
ncbi:hypothetical protein [Ideonella sp.]|uniref:hypothetical protein n=1 Tax=Ideonella sp. TaxID=1929293 RepID=UPI002B4699AA|nr:hypothetical protein [Ideonella sp.]HJV68575.1 hypothetical protein [Ideonella sp.]